MDDFFSIKAEWKKWELILDTSIYAQDIIFKAAYNLLDIGYFFFHYDADKRLVLSISLKDGVETDIEEIFGRYSNQLLDTYLRDRLEKDNQKIRETIIHKALTGPLDQEHFVSYDSDQNENAHNSINFDRDIDDILKEIEEDRELHIDTKQIESVLKEIEEKSIQKPKITANLQGMKDMKEKFKTQ